MGHTGDARDIQRLFALGVEAVVDLAGNEPPVIYPRGWIVCRFPLIDGSGNPSDLIRLAVETVAALIRGDVPTLVFCGAGMSRTPAIAGAAIAVVDGCSLAEGLARSTQAGAADVAQVLWTYVHQAIGEPSS